MPGFGHLRVAESLGLDNAMKDRPLLSTGKGVWNTAWAQASRTPPPLDEPEEGGISPLEMSRSNVPVGLVILLLLVLAPLSCALRSPGGGDLHPSVEHLVPVTLLPSADTSRANRSTSTDTPTIRMVGPDGTDGSRLAPWREGVGVPVEVRSPEARGTPVDSLLVVTWNVHVGGGDVLRFVDDLRSGRITGDPVDHFLILLQEAHRAGMDIPATADGGGVPARIGSVPPSGERIDIVEATRRLGLNLVYAPSMRNGFNNGGPPEDRGNAILSTLPLTDPMAIELPYESQRRVSTVARVEGVDSLGSPWRFKAVSVHLDTRSRWSRLLDSLGPARLRQARGLVEALSMKEPTVLGGDLNTWFLPPLEEALPYLLERFPDTPRTQGDHTFQVAGIIRLHLDHLLYRLPDPYRAGSVGRVDSRYGSDHFPVLGWLHVGADGPGGDPRGGSSS